MKQLYRKYRSSIDR